MPVWSINTQAALSAGDQLLVLTATDTLAANGSLKGFAFTPQATPIVVTIVNNSGQTLTLQCSADNVVWTTMTLMNGVAGVTFSTATASSVTLGSGLNYRLNSAVAITAGGTVWIAR